MKICFTLFFALLTIGRCFSYDREVIISRNQTLLTKFDFLKKLSLNKKTRIAIIGDYIHIDAFTNIIEVNESEIPENNLDDDKNGFTDDYQGFNFDKMDGRLSGPYMWGHENSIVSILDTVINHYDLKDRITILPININVSKPRFDEFKVKKIADAIDYARIRGVEVISMSLGISKSYKSFFRFIDDDYEKSIQYYNQAIQRARDAGIIMLAASSNDPNLNHIIEQDIPSSSPGVFSISNVDYQGNLRSAYGENVDTAFYGANLYLWGGDNEGYAIRTGSSYATPLVALTMALAISVRSGPLGHEENVRYALRNSCEKRILGKKRIASGCVFSPGEFIRNVTGNNY